MKRVTAWFTLSFFAMTLSILAQEPPLDKYLVIAESNFNYGNWDKAIRAANDFLQMNPNAPKDDLAKIFSIKALCLERKNNYHDAKYFAKCAIEYGYSIDQASSGIFKVAQKDFNDYNNALYLFTKEQFGEAEKCLTVLLDPYRELHSNDRVKVLFLLGRTFAKQDKFSEAKNKFWALLKIDSNYIPPDGGNIEAESWNLFMITKNRYNSFGAQLKRNWYMIVIVVAVPITLLFAVK